MSERGTRIVTPLQFTRGYRRLALVPSDAPAESLQESVPYTVHPFVKIRDLPDGNILVEEPA